MWDPDRREHVFCHTLQSVYREMIWQIARDYSSLPDVREMTMGEIAYWYAGLRGELKRASKPTEK